jgi:hypothetical protein
MTRRLHVTKTATIALAALLGAALAGGFFWWQLSGGDASSQPQVPAQVAAPVIASVAAAPSAPAILHPVPAAEPGASAVPSFEDALVELFGRKSVAALFRTDDFERRFVATVDNLGRSSAPASLWPMNPAGGRFQVADAGPAQVIQADNSLRYVPYVLLLERLDLRLAVQTYARHYPALQQEYEELGFPNRYFNDRFIEVLDQLLATPDGTSALRVHRPPINGPQPARPWLLYEFDDPALQALSAGQRTLLRMGPVNERRVKVRLAELRRLLAAR